MNCFRYKLEHDYGFAPNPFYGVLSLATCKGDIRINKNLGIGDWIIGLGSVSMGNLGRIIFAMKLEEKLTFDQYWADTRFQCKKPNICGSLIQMYGDNVYHTDNKTGNVIQENCAHSNEDGTVNQGHFERDVKGKYVLLSTHFYYFGENAPMIPQELAFINVSPGARNIQYRDLDGNNAKKEKFVKWIESTYDIGIHGDPCNWKEYNLPSLEIYEDE